MSFRDNSLSIEVNEVLDLNGSKFNNSNKLIKFVDGWYPPYIYSTEINNGTHWNCDNSVICGSFAKIMEQLSIQYGYK